MQKKTEEYLTSIGWSSERMVELAQDQKGFLGLESVRGDDGLGITVSYWESREAIAAWGAHGEHVIAKQHGRQEFYLWYHLRIAKVEQTRSFDQPDN